MDILNLVEVEKKASVIPDAYDCYNKLYSPNRFESGKFITGIPFGTANSQIPAYFYLSFADNAYFFLTHISASYKAATAGAIDQKNSPSVRFTDVGNGQPLNTASDLYLINMIDNFYPISGHLTPGAITTTGGPGLHEDLVYLMEFPYLFKPQGQLLIEVLNNPSNSISGIVDIVLRGFEVRIGKV